ncbi:MAG: anaerobic ribonucleoside-triphosphate reductase [Rickettsiales bacterium]|nr:anaerobic ribonucleoside-triphosphate reductase [Rickettsiales bacterium]
MMVENAKRTKCEIWTRSMGYCRPVSNFNKGKKSEFKERKFFRESVMLGSMDAHCCSVYGKKAA